MMKNKEAPSPIPSSITKNQTHQTTYMSLSNRISIGILYLLRPILGPIGISGDFAPTLKGDGKIFRGPF